MGYKTGAAGERPQVFVPEKDEPISFICSWCEGSFDDESASNLCPTCENYLAARQKTDGDYHVHLTHTVDHHKQGGDRIEDCFLEVSLECEFTPGWYKPADIMSYPGSPAEGDDTTIHHVFLYGRDHKTRIDLMEFLTDEQLRTLAEQIDDRAANE
jgi:hypothetical protein